MMSQPRLPRSQFALPSCYPFDSLLEYSPTGSSVYFVTGIVSSGKGSIPDGFTFPSMTYPLEGSKEVVQCLSKMSG